MKRRTLELGGLNFVSYAVLTVDMRAVAQANYLWSWIVNFIVAFLTVTILRRVTASSDQGDAFAYALGGANGTLFGLWMSQLLLGR